MRISAGSRGLSRNGGNIHVHPEIPFITIRPRVKSRNQSIPPAPLEIRDAVFREFIRLSPSSNYMEELVTGPGGLLSRGLEDTSLQLLEKIKTIGDAYMAVGGVPVMNRTHAVDCILAALEIEQVVSRLREQEMAESRPYWQIRIGIHSGDLVAGVAGSEKFSYDVWGDTVNTASRLESSGVAGRINISGATCELVKDFFDCECRGKIAAKNKGEIDMYFVNGIKPELAIDSRTPNERFYELYERLGLGQGSERMVEDTTGDRMPARVVLN